MSPHRIVSIKCPRCVISRVRDDREEEEEMKKEEEEKEEEGPSSLSVEQREENAGPDEKARNQE